MTERSMTRNEFLRRGSCLAVGAVVGAAATPCRTCIGTAGDQGLLPAAPAEAAEAPGDARGPMVRPYQLLCTICSLAEASTPAEPKLRAIFEAVRQEPDRPITLCANVRDVSVYQQPGLQDETPEGSEFNRKRDLDILQRMNWAPGTTLPARTALNALLKTIPGVAGICGSSTATSDAW